MKHSSKSSYWVITYYYRYCTVNNTSLSLRHIHNIHIHAALNKESSKAKAG